MYYYDKLNSPIGILSIIADETALLRIDLGDIEKKISGNSVTEQTKAQLLEYFNKKRTEFTVPLSPKGTEFQQKVWLALTEIPYGHTASYEDIAIKTNNPKACRAVGGANNKNPIPIIIPCHRVIGKNGSLIGYAGGTEIKKYLLNLEKA